MATKPAKPDLSSVIKGGGKIKVIVSGQLAYTCKDTNVQVERIG